jgi:hypothetical protein
MSPKAREVKVPLVEIRQETNKEKVRMRATEVVKRARLAETGV